MVLRASRRFRAWRQRALGAARQRIRERQDARRAAEAESARRCAALKSPALRYEHVRPHSLLH